MCYCPTPTLHLNLALTGDGAFLLSPQKTLSVWFISILNYGDTENVLINHLLLVIPMSYPCHYTNLCPHKPHKHAHTHTHTHTHTHAHAHARMHAHTHTHTKHNHNMRAWTFPLNHEIIRWPVQANLSLDIVIKHLWHFPKTLHIQKCNRLALDEKHGELILWTLIQNVLICLTGIRQSPHWQWQN